MTAPLLALDALCGSQACRGHRCPRIRHGYVSGVLRGKCSQHRLCRGFELADVEPATDSPAGVDGSPDRPRGHLPGADPAPDFGGREEAAPPAAGPAAEALDLPRVSAAGLTRVGVTYLCPDLHARCRCRPVRWRVHLERITDGE